MISLLIRLLLHSLIALSTPLLADDNNDQRFHQLIDQAISNASLSDDDFGARVWMIKKNTQLSRYLSQADERFAILSQVYIQSLRYQLSPDLVMAVIQTESTFQHYAISSAGARGLMQIMPFWKQEIGQPEDNLMNIATNIRYGCYILAYYLRKEGGNITHALARYNGSYPRHTYSNKVLTFLEKYWQS